MYHSVSFERGGKLAKYTLAPSLFADHMRYLNDEGYATYSVTDLVSAMNGEQGLGPKPVAVTFDDGYRDIYTHALPAVASWGFTATVYVVSGHIGGVTNGSACDPRDVRLALTADQLVDLVDNGMECGAHSQTHPQLDLLPVDLVRREVRGSKEVLEDQLQREVATFAYPFGYYNRQTKAVVAEAGYTSACCVANTMAWITADRFALPRLRITADTTVDRLEGLLDSSPPVAGLRWVRTKAGVRRLSRRYSRRDTNLMRGAADAARTLDGR